MDVYDFKAIGRFPVSGPKYFITAPPASMYRTVALFLLARFQIGDRLVLALISVMRTLILELSRRGVMDADEFFMILQQAAAGHREAGTRMPP
jgi:hypothetical protein